MIKPSSMHGFAAAEIPPSLAPGPMWRDNDGIFLPGFPWRALLSRRNCTMFDPYHRWLSIPPGQRPPTHYQLLGIATTETDPEVIREAALRQASHVRTYQTGPHAEACATLLNEIGQARVTLLHAEKRREYDARLLPAVPPPVPVASGPPPAGETERPVRSEGFAFDAGTDARVMAHSALRKGRHARSPWASPALWLYLGLLGAGGGLGYWVARTVPVTQLVQPDNPEGIAPAPPSPWPANPGPDKRGPRGQLPEIDRSGGAFS